MERDISGTINEVLNYVLDDIEGDNLLDDFDFQDFQSYVKNEFGKNRIEIKEHIYTGLFYDKLIGEMIDRQKKRYALIYDGIKGKDTVYFKSNNEPINDENASQRSFINLINEFLENFYRSFYSRIKRDTEKICLLENNIQINEFKKDIVELNNKIKWKGTPGEFGAIFNKLFENGYVENPKVKKDIVTQLNKIFEIRTDENAIVTDKYLYQCFGEKEYQYPPSHLKIPLSVNYHKDK